VALSKTRLAIALILALGSTAQTSTVWYVDGVNGNDNNSCYGTQTACKTIGHAISLASSGDSIRVAAATYVENLKVDKALKIMGSGAKVTVLSASNPNLPVFWSTPNKMPFFPN